MEPSRLRSWGSPTAWSGVYSNAALHWLGHHERLLDALDEPERSGFEPCYAELLAEAYPWRPDGRTLFPFRRLFIVAAAPR